MIGCGILRYSIYITFKRAGERGRQIGKFNSLDIAMKIMKKFLKCKDILSNLKPVILTCLVLTIESSADSFSV